MKKEEAAGAAGAAAATEKEEEEEELGFVKVGESGVLDAPGSRLHVRVRGRYVTALNHGGTLFCLDSTCYHAGGPLGLGDIEDHPFVKEPCITCPWHSYTISLMDGGKLYQGLKMDAATKKMVPTGWQKKTAAQRIHRVERRHDGIYIALSSLKEAAFDSDEYGYNPCGEQCARGDKSQLSKGRDGNAYKRSGHVLSSSSSASSS